MAERSRGRRTFAPVFLVGLASGALLAVAGTKPWAVPVGASTVVSPALGADTGEVPLAGALGLVVLAAWGVLLVTRGGVRTALAVVTALAAIGEVVTVLRGRGQAATTLAAELGVGSLSTSTTGWYAAAAVAAPVALLCALAATRWSRAWPAMGSRYDAPTSRSTPAAPHAAGSGGPASARPPALAPDATADPQLELWRALDRGQDPTA